MTTFQPNQASGSPWRDARQGDMKPHRKKWKLFLLGVILTIGVIVAASWMFLHSETFRARLLRELIQQAQESTGARIEVQSISLKVSPLAVGDLYGITAHGREAAGAKPLLHIEHLRVGIGLVALLRHQVQLNELTLDRPEISILSDSNGRTNLPAPANATATSSNYEVQIGHLSVVNGMLEYDDRQTALSAELNGVQSQVSFNPASNSYRGTLSYDRGTLSTQGFRTFEHQSSLDFVADKRHLSISRLDVAAGGSRLQFHGEVADYNNPVVNGTYEALLSGAQARYILKNGNVPSGEVALRGSVKYRSKGASSTFLDDAYIEGRVESRELSVPVRQSIVSLRSLRADYVLENSNLRIAKLQGETLGGRINSESDSFDLKNNSGSAHLVLSGASLEETSRQLQKGRQRAQLVGLANVDVAASWKNGIANAISHAHATFTSPAGAASPGTIPVDGIVDVTYDAARDRASFGDSNLRTGSTQIHLTGVLNSASALNVHFSSGDLHELPGLASDLGEVGLANNSVLSELRGSGDFLGTVTGRLKDPQIQGQLTGKGIQIRSSEWRAIRAHIAVNSHSFKLDGAELDNAQQGSVRLNVNASLVDWSLDSNGPMSGHAQIERLSATGIQHVANTSYPVDGLLTGDITVSGSPKHPSGHGHIDLQQGQVYGEKVNSLGGDFDADSRLIRINAQGRLPAGTLSMRGSYDSNAQKYEINASTAGLKLEMLPTLQAKLQQPTGQVTATISGQGTLKDPQLEGHVSVPNLQIRGENFTQLDAQFHARNQRADFQVRSTVDQTSLQAEGTVDLTKDYSAKMTLDTGTISIAPLLKRYFPSQGQSASGQLEVHANINGPLAHPEKLEGSAEIPTLKVVANPISVSAARPIKLEYRGGVLLFTDAAIKGDNTEFTIHGSIPVQSQQPMNLSAKGSIDLRLLGTFTDGGTSSGEANFDLQAKGALRDPKLDGNVKVSNAAFFSDDLPLGLESMNGEINLAGNRLTIVKMSGTAGGGTLVVGGSAVVGKNPVFALNLETTSARVRQNGIRAVVDASLDLHGSSGKAFLDGRITVQKLSFNQGSDLSQIAAQLSGDDTVSEPSALSRNLKLNVTVQSSDSLNLNSSQLSIGGAANLSVVGTATRPVILGRVTLSSGEVFFLSKRFEIQSGTIAFANATRTDPIVSLYVTTVVQQYIVTINLNGPMDKLKTSYTSDPALSTADIINLLAFGQTTTEAASNATPASVGAESAVAGAVGGQVAGQVQKITGISQLTIDPLAGNNQNPGAQLAIQQRVSGNLLLTFSTDVTSAQNQTIQLQYQARKNVSVSVLRDENGGYGVDLKYHKAF
jgi:translocation and assembly module TamB